MPGRRRGNRLAIHGNPSLLAACLAAAFLPSLSQAAGRLELTLKTTIDMALMVNGSIKAERLGVLIAEEMVREEEGKFDPYFRLDLSEDSTKRRTASYLEATEEDLLRASAAVEGKFTCGTAYQLSWGNLWQDSNLTYLAVNPSVQTDLTLSLTQPLLRGAGASVQTAPLAMANNQLTIARLRNAETASTVMIEATRAYWELAFARENLKVAGLSLELAENLVRDARARAEAGKMAALDVLRAEAEQASRQEKLVRAQIALGKSEDVLRAAMNLDDWTVELVPVDRPPAPGEVPSPEKGIKAAFENRRDYKQLLLEKKSRTIARQFYANQALSELNLTASAGFSGLGGTHKEAVKEWETNDYLTWKAALSWKVPLGNNQGDGRYTRALREEEKAAFDLDNLSWKIQVEVRESWRNLAAAKETIEAVGKTRIAAERKLKAEEDKLAVGKSTLTDVLELQEEYARVLSAEKRAQTDYALALAEMERAKGTLVKDSLPVSRE